MKFQWKIFHAENSHDVYHDFAPKKISATQLSASSCVRFEMNSLN